MPLDRQLTAERWRARPRRVPTPSPWRTVWLSPRQTAGRVLRGDAARFVIIVAWLSGVLDLLQTSALNGSAAPRWGPYMVFLALTLGPLGGFAYFAITGGMVSILARLLGGAADASATRVALACGTAPQLIALPLWVPVLAHYGLDVLTSAQPEGEPGLMAFAGFQLLLWLWSAAAQMAALAEVHRFAVWRAVLAMLLWIVGTVAILLAVAIGVGAALGE